MSDASKTHTVTHFEVRSIVTAVPGHVVVYAAWPGHEIDGEPFFKAPVVAWGDVWERDVTYRDHRVVRRGEWERGVWTAMVLCHETGALEAVSEDSSDQFVGVIEAGEKPYQYMLDQIEKFRAKRSKPKPEIHA